MKKTDDKNKPQWKQNTYNIIFRSDTFYGKLFDELLLVVILAGVVVVMLESIESIRTKYYVLLKQLEWSITILFLIEYLLRIISSPKPLKYIFSFFGIIDLLAILPSFIALGVPGAQSLIIVRALRILRVYRILKLTRYIREGQTLLLALRRSFRRIFIFMIFILILVTLLGSIMYVVEGSDNGFHSIPLGIYWAVITLTTVGYGDIVPMTDLGKFIATFIMLLGYSIIAIPTGIVTAEMSRGDRENYSNKTCSSCGETKHSADSRYCRSCGNPL